MNTFNLVDLFDWAINRQLVYLDEIKEKLHELNAPIEFQDYFDKQTMYRWYPSEIADAIFTCKALSKWHPPEMADLPNQTDIF